MVKVLFISYFCFLIHFLSYAQEIDYKSFVGKPVKISIPIHLDQPYFCEYRDKKFNPVFLNYKEGFKSLTTPEDILLSVYCGTIDKDINIPINKINIPETNMRNGLIFLHKLTIYWGENQLSVVKFIEMKDSIQGKPMSIHFQHIGNVWKTVNIPAIQYIENVILSIRTDIFWEIYMKKDSEIPGLNEVKKKVKDEEGFINMSFLSDFITKARSNDPVTYKMLCDN